MEKNLLPIGVATARPNFDVYAKGTKDNFFFNCFFEVNKDTQTETQSVYCVKRPGISSTVYAGPVTTGSIGLGCFAAQPYNSTNIYFAYQYSATTATVVYFDGTTSTTINGFGGATIPTNKRIVFKNIGMPDDTYNVAFTTGSQIHLIKTTTNYLVATPVVGADLTEPVYLNNRVFVGDRNTGQIFQSDLGDYATYPASEFLTVESYGGKLVSLGRYNNYIVAFKEYSVEFFEDVANENGSVLGRVGQALQQVGCVHPNTIVDTGSGELIWLSNDESGNHHVVKLTNSFNVEPIQNGYLAKYLNLIRNYNGCYGFLLNSNGRQFYVLTLKDVYLDISNGTDISNITFVYDFSNNLWTNWGTYGQSTLFTANSISYSTVGRWAVTGACRSITNTTYIQDHENGSLYQLDDYFANDKGQVIAFNIQIANIDLGTDKRKFLNKLTINTDGYRAFISGVQESSILFLVSLARNDYGSSSEANSNYTVSTHPYRIRALGSYRQKFTLSIGSTSMTPIRISAINLDYDIGEGYGIS